MLLVPVGTGADPDPVAVSQGVYGLLCLRGPDRAALESYLTAPAALLEFQADKTTWPVDLAIVEQGSGKYWLWVYGTTNYSHWADNVTGSVGELWPVSGTTTHGGAVRQAARLAADQMAFLSRPGHAPSEITVYGHSLGGAVGLLCCLMLKRAYPAAYVELVTFGAPKVMCYGADAGLLPDVYHRLEATGDVVPYMPPAAVRWVYSGIPPTGVFLALPLQYAAYGDGATVWPDGTVGPSGSTPYPLPPGVAVSGLAPPHEMPDYWGRLFYGRQRAGGPAAALATYVAAHVLALGVPYDPPDRPLPDQAFVDGTAVAAPPIPPRFQGQQYGATPMAINTSNELTGGGALRVTVYFEWSDIGWEEVFFYYCALAPTDGGGIPINVKESVASAAGWADAYVIARRQCLSSQVEITGARIKRLDNPRSGRTIKYEQFGARGPNPMINVGILAYQYPPSAEWLASRSFRGFDRADLVGLTIKPLDTSPLVVGAARAAFGATQTFLTLARAIYGGAPGQVAVQKTGPLTAFASPISTAVNAEGYLILNVNPALVVRTDLPIRVHHKRSGCFRGLSGTFPVLEIIPPGSGPNPVQGIVIGLRPSCSIAGLRPNTLSWATIGPIYWGFGDVQPERQSTHKSGRPFGLLRGRSEKGK